MAQQEVESPSVFEFYYTEIIFLRQDLLIKFLFNSFPFVVFIFSQNISISMAII